MNERALLLGRSGSLVGVVTDPATAPGDDNKPAVVFLNAGMLHRVGPNRIYVNLARQVAGAGFAALRFDLSGIGDSLARRDGMPFRESALIETLEVMSYLQAKRNIDRFILLGICSGADVAFDVACRDQRVAGAVLINGYYLPDDMMMDFMQRIQAGTRGRYYRRRLFDLRSWWRVISGRSDLASIKAAVGAKIRGLLSQETAVAPGTEHAMFWRPLAERGCESLLVYTEGSTALDSFNLTIKKEIEALSGSGKVAVQVLNDVDHVFTLIWTQELLADMVMRWLADGRRAWNGDPGGFGKPQDV